MTRTAAETGLESELAAALALPGVAVAAIGPDGFRVPVPASVAAPAGSLVPLPADRATMLDVVIPREGLTVVAAWEEALARGRSRTVVHLRDDPDRPLLLTFLDVAPVHGVMVATLSASQDDAVGRHVAPLTPVAAAAPALRPRTAVLVKAYNAVVTGADDRSLRMLGMRREDLVGTRSTDLMHPDDRDRAVASWMEMLSTRRSTRARVRHLCGDGRWLWVEVDNELGTGPDGAPSITSRLSDVSDEMRAHDELAQREQLFRRLAQSLPLGLLHAGADGAVEYANTGAQELLGGTVPTLDGLLATVAPADRPRLDDALHRVLVLGQDSRLDVGLRHRTTGAVLQVALHLIALSDAEGSPGAIVCLQDVTEQARLGRELERRATVDALTGTHNRASLLRRLDTALGSGGAATAVVFIDLDGFKEVNDTHGHVVGDEVLVEVSRRLLEVVRRDDVIGRLGGDEFVVLLSELRDRDEVAAVVRRLEEALREPAPTSAGPVPVSASVGLACSEPGDTSVTLIARADGAMYSAKRRRAGASAPLAGAAART